APPPRSPRSGGADGTREAPRNPGPDQAVSEARPLRRRAPTMLRPARVRIRRRKPCTFERRRLLGWKVRFPLAMAGSSREFGAGAAPVRVVMAPHAPPAGGTTTRHAPRGRMTDCSRLRV